MSQSLVKNLVHLVYSTKHRKPWIPAETRDGLYAYQAGILKRWNSPALVIGGVADHVHAFKEPSPDENRRRGQEREFQMDEGGRS
ncbi:MAG: transposase [Planctomycetes bacterium]|nr:transposase [Planctomycetota bacterium]